MNTQKQNEILDSLKRATRPLAERITQNPVGTPDYAYRTQELSAPFRTVADLDMTGCPRDQREANAELIVEAFNVTHETGRTPRQLAAERVELIAALKDCRESLLRLPNVDGAFRATCYQQATKLLNRITA